MFKHFFTIFIDPFHERHFESTHDLSGVSNTIKDG